MVYWRRGRQAEGCSSLYGVRAQDAKLRAQYLLYPIVRESKQPMLDVPEGK